jgi:hypothetical protein
VLVAKTPAQRREAFLALGDVAHAGTLPPKGLPGKLAGQGICAFDVLDEAEGARWV